MRRIIITALVALTALGGVASADRWQSPRHAQGGVVVTPDRGHQHRGYYQHRGYQPRPRYTYNRGYYVSRPAYRYVRRPIYVQRPVIAYRYYNYYQRPAVIAENYRAMPGYYWVAGRWDWNGYEWIWTPGHYEPDPQCQGYYSNSYDPTYYQPNQYYDSNYNSGTYDNNGYDGTYYNY